MMVSRNCVAIGFAALLTACAGGSDAPVAEPPRLPLQTPLHAHQAPIVHFYGLTHVGADVGAPADRPPPVARHGETRVSHGSIRDGVAAAELTAYLQADAASYLGPGEADSMDVQLLPDGLVFQFAAMPPTVRVAEDTPLELVDETVRVVQAINAALPGAWRIGFDPEPAPGGATDPVDGEILVTFARQADWPPEAAPPDEQDIGLAEPRFAIVPTGDPAVPWRLDIVAGRIWVDPWQTAGRERLGVIAHELIHLLGRSHVDLDRFPGTLMVSGGRVELSGHILHPLDREALLAVYDRLAPGTSPNRVAEQLGSWSDSSMHISGAIDVTGGGIAFGAALRNGLSQPWAVGPTPISNLEDNAALSGSVRWSGRLLGLTTRAETVAGAADLTVELATLSGALELSELEHWAADAAPGAAGSGTAWRDGRLSYGIEVRGNSFIGTGGDAGQVTGAFFGSAHEGMGGVLVREDMSAGFGGRR